MLSAMSTVEDMRRGNLARFLELVHRERALSRAQLTAATGLNRSTVAALAADAGAFAAPYAIVAG